MSAVYTVSVVCIFKVHLRPATVHDWPEYGFRGTLIDTSRHFLPKYVIFRHIELLEQNKYNVLHWHMVDNEGFSYTSVKFPDLAKKGAYSPNHLYTRQDIQDVLRYARLHGVRVLPEFDTPGHVGSWKGQPGFLADCFDGKGHEMTSNILDPTEDGTYNFLGDLIIEAIQTFPENYLHLGGDEVRFWTEQCWLNNTKIANYMEKHGIKGNLTALENMYFKRWQSIVKYSFVAKKPAGRMILWQEVFDNNNP
ncbi:HEX-1 protein, partial [Aphelenchoides avenae]